MQSDSKINDQEQILLKEGNQLRQQGKIAEAINKYSFALQLDPDFFPALNQLSGIYESNQEFHQAIPLLQRAVQLQPQNAWMKVRLANAMMNQGNIDEAISLYQQAITQEQQPLAWWVYTRLGNALQKKGQVDEAITAYKQAVELHPENFQIHLTLAWLYYLNKKDWDSAIESFKQAIKLKPDLSSNIYQKLVELLRMQGREDEAATVVKSLPEVQPGEIYSQIWQALNQTSLQRLEEESVHYPIEFNQKEVEQYFRLTSQYKIINLTSLSDEDRRFLKSHNISLANLKLIGKSNYNAVQEEVYLKHFNHELKPPSKTGVELSQYQLSPFFNSMLETGYIYVTCPMSGRVLKSNQSFILAPKYVGVLYRFIGDEIFYLLAGWIPGGNTPLSAIYFPSIDLIIVLIPWANVNLVPYFKNFKGWAVSHWPMIQNNFSHLKSDKKEVMDAVGFHFNLGHNLVNDLSGIDLLFKTGRINKVDKFFIGDHEYFGRLEDLYPEISKDKIIRLKNYDNSHEKVSKIALENNYLPLTIRGRWVSEDLAKRIYQVSLQKCSPSLLAQVEEAKKCFPLVSISFRCHKRVWVSQIQGLANIIGKLFADFPNLGVVFDGFSLGSSNIDNGGEYSSYLKTQIENDNAVVNQILDLLANKNIKIYNTVGCRMHESIVWAYTVDFYIANMGSNLTKNCTIANKPGIGHTNTDYIEGSKPWFTQTRENACIPTVIPAHYIIDIEPEKGVNSNYDLDWKVIYDEVMKLIPQLSRTP